MAKIQIKVVKEDSSLGAGHIVSLHTGGGALISARRLGADAFTLWHNVFFGDYQLRHPQQVVDNELYHAQQSATFSITSEDDEKEGEAAAAGGPISIGTPNNRIVRCKKV